MSRQNVEVVRRALGFMRESYEAGAATDALLGICAPDVRVDASRRVFNPGIYEGKDGVRRVIAEICETWENFQDKTDELIDAGDRVIVRQTISGTGRTSRAHVEQQGALILTVRGGQVALIEVFTDTEDIQRVRAGVRGPD